ncbi:thioredoxin family protein [Candidatus Poriferisodalis sp.]|uniref:thioredoxin family protein n=1 Tax=Candidatus Poriferisodalis sp. TaxID=3101277 RepID=UPI003B01491B
MPAGNEPPTGLTGTGRPSLADGLVAFVKRDCPTCRDVEPVLAELVDHAMRSGTRLTVFTQDDPEFMAVLNGPHANVVHDEDLAASWHHEIETVPTLMAVMEGREMARTVGWDRRSWEALSGTDGLGLHLAEMRPGCGSISVDPLLADELALRFGATTFASCRVELATAEDPVEAAYDRGWSDGLPVVPPTEARVAAMLAGTSRAPDEIVAVVPPALAPCTVEKVAVNAVMAGCKPEYLPVVLAAVEAACTDTFNMHGLLCTLWFSGPIVIVNGPIRRRIGMNTDKNALGQGNRANSTIGRALQLVIRNVGGGKPGIGGIDRSALGSPSKVGWCFAEDEEGLPDGWPSLSISRGFGPGQDTVTLFAGHGPIGCIDQVSRTPDSLIRTIAQQLMCVGNRKLPTEAMLVMTPEHMSTFADSGWTKERFHEELEPLLQMDLDFAVSGAGGIAEGLPEGFVQQLRGTEVAGNQSGSVDGGLVFGSAGGAAGGSLRKLPPWSPMVVRAGGGAGGFSAIIEGWVPGAKGSTPITHPITP